MVNYDISFFMDQFIVLLLDSFTKFFNTLDSIKFFGFSLLSYTISLFVLSAAIPIIISIVSGGYSYSKGVYRRSRSSSERSGGSEDE